MPTTDSAILPIGIVSPSPQIPRTRSFTMPDFTSITKFSFRFGPHHLNTTLATALNNTYSEPFADAVVASIFADTGKTTVAQDAVVKIQTAAISAIEVSSQTDRLTIAPIINSMLMYVTCGKPTRRFLIRCTSTTASALTAAIQAGETTIVIFSMLHHYTLILLATILWISLD